ncbi:MULTISPECIES: class C sortase [Actinotignum]|uniref:Class C sortase n=2 Tax=Actinotignum TaxID=1653174 RepID=A0AAW9HPG3_9ACTO|nr:MULTISPECIES: class C sortase [Actinotignum]MDE1559209.1 class C sortase [Actinotignum schaalii]MDE1664199.1 class C sortase [Actinotignum schaalii]MDK6372766.1 class C sortase [Actinotignum timonense]MDK6419875.1 class C sortase [Actinotignum timonense]MDK6591140.1 class C sortase [Actinotignum timonense]
MQPLDFRDFVKMKKRANSKRPRFMRALLLVLAGTLCLAYPLVSTLWNNYQAKLVVQDYVGHVNKQAEQVALDHLESAREYNKNRKAGTFTDPYSHTDIPAKADDLADFEKYLETLNEPAGAMATVTIPEIGVNLPVYHGTSYETLQRGAGHLYGSDLPVGGTDRHAIITAHSGLPNSTMFDQLNHLDSGDMFYINVQGTTLQYKVTDINVVDPTDIKLLQRQTGRDLATLITCTPYGINSHRLLVTGERVLPDRVEPPPAGHQWSWWMTLFIFAILAALAICAMIIFAGLRRRKDEKNRHAPKHALKE